MLDSAPIEQPRSTITSPEIQKIVEMWRQREDMVRAHSKLTLAGKSALRRACGNDKDVASKVFDTLSKELKKGIPPSQSSYPEFVAMVTPFLAAQKPLVDQKVAWEKALEKMGKDLPIAHMTKDIKGITYMTLAKVVGELGDLSAYDKGFSGICKRAGLAVIDGERQRKCANAEKAIAHGYNPSRRSVFWNITDSMFKSQGKLDEETGVDTRTEWRKYYDDRKALEMARPGMTKGQAHNRAMRMMTKKLLRRMHREWMRAVA